MNTNLLPIIFGVSVLAACGMKTDKNYSVTIPVDASDNDKMAYLIDFDSSEKIDSVIVSNALVTFEGHVDEPFIGRLILDGARGPVFIVEQGNIVLSDEKGVSGTPLNDKMESYNRRLVEISEELRSINSDDSIQTARVSVLKEEYNNLPSKAYKENIGNPVALYWFLQGVYDMDIDLSTLDSMIASDKNLASSKRVESFRNSLIAKSTTNIGNHYKDFTITYEGKDQKLSDYVKPGEYTLVDFWASWCGPCIRQTKVIKELYEKYKDKGLNIVGVAVWDEPDNTLNAIETHNLSWPCIINAQSVPTDLYGISSIPCIILINPEGMIVSRDKLGDELKEDVDRELSVYVKPAGENAVNDNI